VLAHPDLAAQVADASSGVVLLEHGDDLLLGEAALLISVLLLQEDRHNFWIRIRG